MPRSSSAYDVDVSLVLAGDGLESSLITSMLQTAPTRAWMQGELRPDGHSTSPAKVAGWELDSGLSSNSVEDHVAHLLQMIGRFPTSLLELPNVKFATLRFRTVSRVHSEDSQELEWDISPGQMRDMARLGIGIEGTVRWQPPKEDGSVTS